MSAPTFTFQLIQNVFFSYLEKKMVFLFGIKHLYTLMLSIYIVIVFK